MSASFRRIVLKATIAAAISLAATLAITFSFVPFFGGKVAGLGLMMTLICPVAIGFPVSAFQFWQLEKLKAARDEMARMNAKFERMHCDLQAAHSALAEKARRDAMTGALNRESFLADVAATLAGRESGTLVFTDLDHFKQVNDTFGHLAGDDALRAAAAAISASLRSGDIFGRIGGEEFAVFLAGLDGDAAFEHAERIRVAVEQLQLSSEGGIAIPLTVSIGMASHYPGKTLVALMRESDLHLYRAKNGGRNRVVHGETVVADDEAAGSAEGACSLQPVRVAQAGG